MAMRAQLVHANANAVSRQLKQTRDAQSATQCTSNPYLITGCDKHAPSHVARHSYSTAAEPAVFWLKSANDVELAALPPALHFCDASGVNLRHSPRTGKRNKFITARKTFKEVRGYSHLCVQADPIAVY